jgi:hypothetical protein
MNRAVFELGCPESELTVVTLSPTTEREYRLITGTGPGSKPFPINGDTVGVTGCGKEAIYVYVGQSGGGGAWVNNSGLSKTTK